MNKENCIIAKEKENRGLLEKVADLQKEVKQLNEELEKASKGFGRNEPLQHSSFKSEQDSSLTSSDSENSNHDQCQAALHRLKEDYEKRISDYDAREEDWDTEKTSMRQELKQRKSRIMDLEFRLAENDISVSDMEFEAEEEDETLVAGGNKTYCKQNRDKPAKESSSVTHTPSKTTPNASRTPSKTSVKSDEVFESELESLRVALYKSKTTNENEIELLKEQIVKHAEALDLKDLLLSQHVASITERDALISEKDAALAEKESVIAAAEGLILEKDSRIKEQDAAILEKDSQLAGKEASLAEKESVIQAKSVMVSSLAAKMKSSSSQNLDHPQEVSSPGKPSDQWYLEVVELRKKVAFLERKNSQLRKRSRKFGQSVNELRAEFESAPTKVKLRYTYFLSILSLAFFYFQDLP